MDLKWEHVAIAPHLRRDSAALGAEGPWKMKATMPDGFELRVMWGREPFMLGSQLGYHISVSVSTSGRLGPFKRPSDAECAAAVDRVKLGRPIKLEEENQPDGDPLIRHFWQI